MTMGLTAGGFEGAVTEVVDVKGLPTTAARGTEATVAATTDVEDVVAGVVDNRSTGGLAPRRDGGGG
jgi:hypothetical protein